MPGRTAGRLLEPGRRSDEPVPPHEVEIEVMPRFGCAPRRLVCDGKRARESTRHGTSNLTRCPARCSGGDVDTQVGEIMALIRYTPAQSDGLRRMRVLTFPH